MDRTKFAQVIINKSNINIDRYFDYKIPDSLLECISIGQRVIVPFGIGNKKIDAFIINIKDFCNVEDKKLKYIDQIIDMEPIITINQLRLANWIKEYYLCTHIEAIQLMIPTGLNIEKKIKIILNKEKMNEIEINKHSNSIDKKVLEYLNNQQSEIKLEEIEKLIVYKNLNKVLKELAKKKYIFIEERFNTKIKDKKEKYISLSGKYKDKDEYLKNLNANAHKQIAIINNLEHFPYNYNELRRELNFNTGSINTLLEKELIKITSKMVFRNPYIYKNFNNPIVPLTEEQNNIVKAFYKLSNKKSQKFLIHGVTGSGKTEIYLNMIEIMLKQKKQSILLVPEISLTPQMVERVIGRFGDQISILHSGLSNGEKYDQWSRIKSGEINIVIGARSAIFAPLENLGLIIIDEEHETTYKSSTRPRYHSREIAEKRCENENCHIVLGSATPSIESYYKSKNNEYNLFLLKKRVDNIPMPSITLVDMRNELKEGNYSILSNKLREEIEIKLQKKEQIILFLNRRGYSTFLSCRQCGHVEKCPNCDVSLTFHHNNSILMCHYCGYKKYAPKVCPSCNSSKIKYFGTGTQKVEDIIAKVYPDARILRMDADTTKRKGAHDRILNAFKNKQADILIGTQMIAKGLDFPNVTLVGVITADTSLNLPDFRAAERTFQLTTQVAGRAGRGALLGKVIVQTYEPEHYSLIHAKSHDYYNFYNEEVIIRKEMLYPPFKNIINIIFSCVNEDRLIKFSNKFYIILIDYFKSINKEYLISDIYKPVPAEISKISNKYRWHMIIKTNHIKIFKNILRKAYREYLSHENEVNIAIDIDPVSLL
jgi:primosomal protein N' (replication factor Y)